MIELVQKFNIYMLPPFLCLVIGLTLAGISIFRGKIDKENILFSVVCVWWSLLAPVFLLHHLVDDEQVILRIERIVHFFYVYNPFVNILFFHQILGIRRKAFEIGAFVASGIISISTQTNLYFDGLYRFSWGYIARGQIFFQIFGVYGFLVVIYVTAMTFQTLLKEKNQIVRLKLKYIIISLIISSFLTILNIPAINGIDFYPFGNFMFIPLSIMAYGILRYRLLDIRSIIHLTIIWGAISALIVIPNALLFWSLHPRLIVLEKWKLFVVLFGWFGANYLYLRNVQPLIDQFFNRRKYDLRKFASEFIDEISILKNLQKLRSELAGVVKKALNLKSVGVLLRKGNSDSYVDDDGLEEVIDREILEWFIGANHLAEKHMVMTNPYYSYIREKLISFLERKNCSCVVPLVQNNELLGLIMMGEKSTLSQLTPDEVAFINSIRAAGSIALANSIMYQDLSNMKDNLEDLVRQRTKELQKKNEQMLFELKIAKNVQETILPTKLPYNEHIKIASKIIPLMEVSGDFYDVIRISDDRVAIAMVDVSGHGVPSALLTSMIKTEIDNQLKTHTDPAIVCTRINQNLRLTLSETGFYCTMILCLIDLSKMEMEYSNCGHISPIVVKTDGKVEMLTTEGFIIGTLLDASYETKKLQIETGDRIYFYTDGLIEARGYKGEQFGESRFIDLILQTKAQGVETQLATILATVEEFGKQEGAEKRDDITLMIVEVGIPISISRRIKEAYRFYKRQDYRKAVEILHHIDESSLSSIQLYLLGRLYFGVGDSEKALYYLNRALENEPAQVEFLYFKAKVLYKLNRLKEALEIFVSVKKIKPNYKRVENFIERINQLL
ncbi:MAG: SpoIIE family protein phosphatase [Spirochaetes bacterium]|nr:SpoIIE family protein phosphatase [Spirochaetota bacterium]